MTLLEMKQKIHYYVRRAGDREEALRVLAGILKHDIPHYTGVYFYFLEDSRETLRLEHYAGRPTDLTTIPVSQGVCGACIREQAPIIVPDVSKDDRYLSCSTETRSEIVVPIWKDGRVIGEIDIDSDELDPFGDPDVELLETAARTLSERL